MPDDAIQVELGGDDQPEHSPGGPGGGKAVWLIVGLGLGFALALLFGSSIDRGAIGGADSTTTTAAPALGVGAAIPGFPDGLNVLVSPGEGRALEVLTWPHQGEPFYRSVPLEDMVRTGTAAHFDVSGQFLAAMTSTPDGFILRTGRPNTFGVVATRVTGFAWHDSDPADLALSTYNDGELQIWVSDDLGGAELAVSAVGVGDHLVAFGDWGFAVGSAEAEDYVLGPNGELVGSIAGRIVASHQSGRLLVIGPDPTETMNLIVSCLQEAGWPAESSGGGFTIAEDPRSDVEQEQAVEACSSAVQRGGGPSIVATDDLETMFDIPGAGVESVVIGAEFSPDGDRVALTGLERLTIVEFGEIVELETFPIRAGSDSLSWSSDGRFVLVSAFRGVAVLDTETGEITSILESETTRAVAATPIG